jgi:Cyanobacterial TRADD-N associated 2-Transmembrane domain
MTSIPRPLRGFSAEFSEDFALARPIRQSIERLGTADPKNVQQIAAAQIELLSVYHQEVLAQSRQSFFWALIGSGAGLALFIVAVLFSLLSGPGPASVPLVAGTVVEVVAGLGFYLYGKASSQMSAFHRRLDVLQRYLLANSICESLDDEAARNTARTALIQEISRTPPPVTLGSPDRSARRKRRSPSRRSGTSRTAT